MSYLLFSWSLWVGNSRAAQERQLLHHVCAVTCHDSHARLGVAKQGTQLGLWPGVPASPCLLGFLGARQPHGSGASYWKLMANIKSYPGTLKYSPDTWRAFYQIRSFVVFLEDSKSLSLPMSQVLGGGVTEWKARTTWYGQCMYWRLQDLGSGFLIVLDS